VFSDGLACFGAVTEAGCIDHTADMVGGKSEVVPEFNWINTILGNFNTSLSGSHAKRLKVISFIGIALAFGLVVSRSTPSAVFQKIDILLGEGKQLGDVSGNGFLGIAFAVGFLILGDRQFEIGFDDAKFNSLLNGFGYCDSCLVVHFRVGREVVKAHHADAVVDLDPPIERREENRFPGRRFRFETYEFVIH
jgi:hypothetical protein